MRRRRRSTYFDDTIRADSEQVFALLVVVQRLYAVFGVVERGQRRFPYKISKYDEYQNTKEKKESLLVVAYLADACAANAHLKLVTQHRYGGARLGTVVAACRAASTTMMLPLAHYFELPHLTPIPEERRRTVFARVGFAPLRILGAFRLHIPHDETLIVTARY